MLAISQMGGGNFYYVENIEQIDQYFADALGAIVSSACKGVKLEIEAI